MRHALRVLVISTVVGTSAIAAAPLADAGPPVHCNQVNVHPNSLPVGQEGVAYGPGNVLTLTPNSLAIPIQSYAIGIVSGTLPPNLSLALGPNGNQVSIVGTPAIGSQGTYTFTVQIGGTYVLGTICNVTKAYTIVVVP